MLVRAKLNIVVTRDANRKDKSHTPFAVHKLSNEAVRNEFRKSLEESLTNKPHVDGGMPEVNWEALKSCVVATAEETLGNGGKNNQNGLKRM